MSRPKLLRPMEAERAVAASGLKRITRAIALELVLVTDSEKAEAHVYVEKLSERTGWGKRIIYAALERIEDVGLVRRIRTGAASIYRWSLEAIARLIGSDVKAARALDRQASMEPKAGWRSGTLDCASEASTTPPSEVSEAIPTSSSSTVVCSAASSTSSSGELVLISTEPESDTWQLFLRLYRARLFNRWKSKYPHDGVVATIRIEIITEAHMVAGEYVRGEQDRTHPLEDVEVVLNELLTALFALDSDFWLKREHGLDAINQQDLDRLFGKVRRSLITKCRAAGGSELMPVGPRRAPVASRETSNEANRIIEMLAGGM